MKTPRDAGITGWRCAGKANRVWHSSGLKNRIVDEVDADSTRRGAFVKMNYYRIRDLLLQIAKILPLGCDATGTIRVVPPRYEQVRLLVTLNLKVDLFHY